VKAALGARGIPLDRAARACARLLNCPGSQSGACGKIPAAQNHPLQARRIQHADSNGNSLQLTSPSCVTAFATTDALSMYNHRGSQAQTWRTRCTQN
jgi:hypothetical protein